MHAVKVTQVGVDPSYFQNALTCLSERLVHGPLTALMLLDTTAYFHPLLQFKSFEYRALNPLVVNRTVTIRGAWENDKTVLVWAVDPDDVVVMSGRITV